ncbi:MAG: LPXTG cell wall anchor domain-containing protein, partial [Chloroflexota bacterium]
EFFLDNGKNLVWVGNAYHTVDNGNLVRLDPRVFVSGTYQLLVRQVNKDFNYTDMVGPTITIDNPKDAPLPYYPEIEPSMLYPSEDFAIVRVRNCTGEDFNYDYTSPEDFKSAGDSTLPGKPEGYSVCPFHDLALVPGEYRGTGQGGGQIKGVPINFTVDEWHVYELIYNGPVAGGDQVFFQEVPADEMDAVDDAAVEETYSDSDKVKTDEKAVAQPEKESEPEMETMLPTTGDQDTSSQLPIALTLGFIALLGVGGYLAVRRRQFTNEVAKE